MSKNFSYKEYLEFGLTPPKKMPKGLCTSSTDKDEEKRLSEQSLKKIPWENRYDGIS